jgi:hypothetical protein
MWVLAQQCACRFVAVLLGEQVQLQHAASVPCSCGFAGSVSLVIVMMAAMWQPRASTRQCHHCCMRKLAASEQLLVTNTEASACINWAYHEGTQPLLICNGVRPWRARVLHDCLRCVALDQLAAHGSCQRRNKMRTSHMH